jgi:hypothetical protein
MLRRAADPVSVPDFRIRPLERLEGCRPNAG